MLLNHNNGLHICGEGFAMAQAQHIEPVSHQLLLHGENSATFWPDSGRQNMTQQPIFDAASSLLSVWCVGAISPQPTMKQFTEAC